jgi:hypothetical protein
MTLLLDEPTIMTLAPVVVPTVPWVYGRGYGSSVATT